MTTKNRWKRIWSKLRSKEKYEEPETNTTSPSVYPQQLQQTQKPDSPQPSTSHKLTSPQRTVEPQGNGERKASPTSQSPVKKRSNEKEKSCEKPSTEKSCLNSTEKQSVVDKQSEKPASKAKKPRSLTPFEEQAIFERSQHASEIDISEMTDKDKELAKDNPSLFINSVGHNVINKSTCEIKTTTDEKVAEQRFERNLTTWSAKHQLPLWAQEQLRQQMKRELERRRTLRKIMAEKGDKPESSPTVMDSIREKKKSNTTTIVVASGVRGVTDSENLDDQFVSSTSSSTSTSTPSSSTSEAAPRALSFRCGQRAISRKTLNEVTATKAPKSHLPDLMSLIDPSASSDTASAYADSEKTIAWNPWAPLDELQKRSSHFADRKIKENTLVSTALMLLSPNDIKGKEASHFYDIVKKRPRVKFHNKCTVYKYEVSVRKVKK